MRKFSERDPSLVAWLATMIAMVHREAPSLLTKTPNERRDVLRRAACVADDVIDMMHDRVETELERLERREREAKAEHEAREAFTRKATEGGNASAQ